MRKIILFFTALLAFVSIDSIAQTSFPCGPPLYYFNPTAQEAVYIQPLPTPWFAVRMTPQWDARVDSAYISFGIVKNNSAFIYDSLEVRVLDTTLPTINVLDVSKTIIPANISGQIPDDYWIVEFYFDANAAIVKPPKEFWLAWRLLGSSQNYARIRLRKPALNPSRSVVIQQNGTTIPVTSYVWFQIQDTVDLWAQTNMCYINGYPVEFAAFTASYQKSLSVLEWVTASESNNLGFEIERTAGRSDDGRLTVWRKIGFVHGNGNTNTEQKYRFVDTTPCIVMDESGIVRYRLKQIDFDGSASYSSIREIRIPSSSEGFELYQNYPNPCSNNDRSTMIGFSIPCDEYIRIDVTNIYGQIISTLTDQMYPAGYHSVALPISNLPAGMYFYTLVSGNTHLTKRLTLQK